MSLFTVIVFIDHVRLTTSINSIDELIRTINTLVQNGNEFLVKKGSDNVESN